MPSLLSFLETPSSRKAHIAPRARQTSETGVVMAKIGSEDIFLTDTGGDKPALLFVHGLTFDHTVWQSQVGAFSADFRVVCVDLRGHGRSTAANPDISFEDHAADLATLIDTLGLKDVTLVGWSMGGAIAQLFAATYSGKISHLVLVGSTPQLLADDKFKHALPPEAAQELATLMVQDYAQRLRRALRHDGAGGPARHSDADGDRYEKPAQCRAQHHPEFGRALVA